MASDGELSYSQDDQSSNQDGEFSSQNEDDNNSWSSAAEEFGSEVVTSDGESSENQYLNENEDAESEQSDFSKNSISYRKHPSQMTDEELREAGFLMEPREGDATHAGQMDLRVGEIVLSGQHDEDDLLLVQEVDLGTYDESRLIATNISKHFKKPEELVGEKIVVLCNCIPLDDRGIQLSKTGLALISRKIVEDENMKLISDNARFVQPPYNAQLGAKVYVETVPYEPFPPNTEEEIFDFVIRDFKVDSEGIVKYKGLPLLVEGCGRIPCTAHPMKDSPCLLG